MTEIYIHFEKIKQFKLTDTQTDKLESGINLHGYSWTHSNFSWLKVVLNKKLRMLQKNRCCYCRRVLLHNRGAVEIDHIVDKGSQNGLYARFTFELLNLALSCKDCNNNKGTKKVLINALAPNASYPTKASEYQWVHPYLHKYSDHVTIHQGWVYEAKFGSPDGYALIDKCKLNKLCSIEKANRQVIVASAVSLQDAIAKVVGLANEAGLDNICREFGKSLAQKWKSNNAAGIKAEITKVYNDIAK